LVLWAIARILLHAVTNGQYGFHHDELATLDDARSMAWGYVAYPPLTPFLARIAFILFGPSLIGLRFFAAVAMGLVLMLTGLMARRLGGGRQAQIVAALAAAIGGVAFSAGTLFQYVSFDYLWWVAAAYLMVRLLASDDPRWCLAVGVAIGLGMLTKYTMIFLAVEIVAGFLFTPARVLYGAGLSHVARYRGGMGRTVGCFVGFALARISPSGSNRLAIVYSGSSSGMSAIRPI
jgi:4-amino-4-deoxy-L-arabinose transferase-like glycosyltransferase